MMVGDLQEKQQREYYIGDALKGWIMTLLTLTFVSLYAAALFGWLKPLTDFTMTARLEPIIFVIVGYYFGRLPAQQNEKTLKGEINRQTQKADAAQFAKEKTLKEREVLEEKIKNAKSVLIPDFSNFSPKTSTENSPRENSLINIESAQYSIKTAVSILSL